VTQIMSRAHQLPVEFNHVSGFILECRPIEFPKMLKEDLGSCLDGFIGYPGRHDRDVVPVTM